MLISFNFQGEVSSSEHIEVCKDLLCSFYLPKVRINELFLPDVEATTAQLEQRMRGCPPAETTGTSTGEVLKIIQDPEFSRLGSSVNLEVALRKYNRHREGAGGEEERVSACLADFKRDLQCLGG